MFFNEQEIKPFKRMKVIFSDKSEPDYTSYYFSIEGETQKNLLDNQEKKTGLPRDNEFPAIEYKKYENGDTEINYAVFEKRYDENYRNSDAVITQTSEELNKDKNLTKLLEDKTKKYDEKIETNENIIKFRVRRAYDTLHEIRGEQYFIKEYGKNFDDCEEWIKDDEVLNLWEEIEKNFNEYQELTAKGYNISGKQEIEKKVSPYDIQTLRLAKDTYDYYDLALDFERPSRFEMREKIDAGYLNFDNITKGYNLEEENGITIVENHSLDLFENNEKLARQYTLETNIKTLKEGKDILTKNTEFYNYVIPATTLNLSVLNNKGLLLPIKIHAHDDKTGQIEAVRGFLAGIEKKEDYQIDDWKCHAFIKNIGGGNLQSSFTIDKNKTYTYEDSVYNKKTTDVKEIMKEISLHAKRDAELPLSSERQKKEYEYLNSLYKKTKENTEMKQKNYSYIVKDSTEFEIFETFEPIKDLTASQAAQAFKKLYNEGKNPGITLKIPGDTIFGEWSEEGISIAVLDPDNKVNLGILGDTFIKNLKENDERSRTYIDAYKELYNELEKSGIPVKKPNFVYEKEKELFSTNNTDEQADKYIESMQANGGMSENAMEKDVETSPKPDYLDEKGNPHFFDEDEEEYDDGQLPLEVIDKTQMLYFKSDKVAANEYIIRIDEGLFKEIAPKKYSKTSFETDEIPAIIYRKSTDPDVPNQFLISKFKEGDYDYPLIQKTINISDPELIRQINGITEDYERIKKNENNFIPSDNELDNYLNTISDPKFDEKMSEWWDKNNIINPVTPENETDRQMSAKKEKTIEIEKYEPEQILNKLPEKFVNELLEDEKKMSSEIITIYKTEENPFDYIAVEKSNNSEKYSTHQFTYDEKHDIQSTMSTGHYDFENRKDAEEDALGRVLNQTNIATLFGKNTDYNFENTEIRLKDNSEYSVKNLTKKELYAAAYAEKIMPELNPKFLEEYKKEFPMLKNEKPSIDFIAKAIEKHPEFIDTTSKYIQNKINLIRNEPDNLNPFDRNAKFFIEQAYDNFEANNNKETIQLIYEKKIESLKEQENELKKKNTELEKKEKELDRREKNIAKEEKTISEKFKNLQNFTENFDKCIRREGEYKQLNSLPRIFEGLSQEQINKIWKTVESEANRIKTENKNSQKETKTNTSANKGSHR